MKKSIIILTAAIFLVFSVMAFFPNSDNLSFAQGPAGFTPNPDGTGGTLTPAPGGGGNGGGGGAMGGGYETWISNIMVRLATAVWQFFAGITAIMFVVAGILFVTANGDPGKISTAKQAVIWGVVGIIVSTVAFSIVQVVSNFI